MLISLFQSTLTCLWSLLYPFRRFIMSDSSSEDEISSMEQQQQEAAVREHSYLRGTANPLFPALLVEQRRRRQEGRSASISSSSNLLELPVLELEGVVLFPGSTLPLRLKDASWIDYLGQKIDESRGHPTEEVRIGVITHVRTVDRRRSSALRMAFTAGDQRQGLLVVHVNQELEADYDGEDDYEPDQEEEQSDAESDDEMSAEYHELMDDGDDSDVGIEEVVQEAAAAPPAERGSEENENAEEVSHQDPEEDSLDSQQQPESAQFEHEVEQNKNDEDPADEQESDSQQQHQNEEREPTAQASELRYNVNLVEENLDRIDQSLNDAQEVLDSIQGQQIDHGHLLNISRRLDRAEEAQRPIVEAFDAILDMIRSGAQLSDPMFRDLLSDARRHRVRVSQQLDRMQSIHFRLRHLNEQGESGRSGDPLIGRIGTVATVSYTFDESSDILDVGSSESSRNEDRDELVVAVLGT